MDTQSSPTPPTEEPVSNQEPSAESTQAPVQNNGAQNTPAHDDRFSKIKTAFLYVLIAALAAAAITSVIALLVGQFNAAISKSLLTIAVFFSHSLIILALLSLDKFNQIGKLLLPTALTALTFLSMLTITLGIWEIISAETTWRALGLYYFALGAVYIIIGQLRLRIANQATLVSIYTSIGFIVATIAVLTPWVLQIYTSFDPLYYRVVAALTILAATSYLIGIVMRGIAISKDKTLKLSAPERHPVSGGLFSIYIIAGVITGLVWFGGFTAFLISGVQASNPYSTNYYEDSRYY